MTPSKRVLNEIEKIEGLREIKGQEHEPLILEMFATVGHQWVRDDETAWCAACMGYVLDKAGMKHTGKLNARSYLDLSGEIDIDEAVPGDIVIFSRGNPDGWQGHVAVYYDRASNGDIICIGGNQSDMVKKSTYRLDRLLGVRRPTPLRKSVNQTKTVRGVKEAGTGVAVAAVLQTVQIVNDMTAPAQAAAQDPSVSPTVKLLIGAGILVLIGFGLYRVWNERRKKFEAGDR